MTTTNTSEVVKQTRLHALDAVRGIALLLGIVLHGTMSYLPGLAAAGWPIVDTSPSDSLGVAFYVIHIFRMATFFMIAGFFARFLYHRHGLRTFIRHRRKRILYPLLVFWLPVFLCIVGAFIWAASKIEGFEPVENPHKGLLPFPLAHLWFLYILIWLYAATISVRAATVRFDSNSTLRSLIDRSLNRLADSPVSSLVLAVPIALVLNAIPEWHWWGGIPTPDYSLDPNIYSLVIFLYVFVIGWVLERQRHLLLVFQKRSVVNLLIGTAATVACISIAGWDTRAIQEPAAAEWKLVYAACYAVAVTGLSFGFLGAGMAFFSRENPVVRYLSDASYWIYIWHLPVVFFLQALFMDFEFHWSVEFPVILLLACIPLIVSYDYLVRPTWIGKMLNGRKYPKGLPGRSPTDDWKKPTRDTAS